MSHRAGTVSILGRPSTGKSTLLNALVGAKLSIVASKPQTTRTVVQGVLTLPEAQIVFLDTPGIHKSETMYNRRMIAQIRVALEARDLIVYVADATRQFETEDTHALDMIRKAETPVVLVLNKIDLVEDKRYLLPRIDAYQKALEFVEYLPVSAKTGDGLDALRAAIVARLPEGAATYPEDYLTDQPERFLAAEFIREQIIHETHQEVPHSVCVRIETWEDSPRMTRIGAAIYVEKAGQKGIVIGSKGAMLKQIGSVARGEIEKMLDRRVFLELFVKVKEGWREDAEFLNALDWRTE